MKLYFFALFLILPQLSFSESILNSQFGFSASFQDGWFVVSPNEVAEYTEAETLQSLGIPKTVDSVISNEILEKIKGGNIEFFYDENYIDKEYKNHISIQLSAPLLFESMDDVTEACEVLPTQLAEVFSEEVEIHSCQALPSNDRIVFHHSYTVSSQGVTVINESVFVNNDYSIVFVGGSGNGIEGLHRVRAAQQSLVDALTAYLKSQIQ